MGKKTILGLSDYGNTGISESLAGPLRHWHDNGNEIWQIALGFNGWVAGADPKVYPWKERLLRVIGGDSNAERFGQVCLPSAVKLAKPDVVISSFDVWMVSYLASPHTDPVVGRSEEAREILGLDTRSFTHVAYFPIDGLVEGKYLPRHFDEMVSGFDYPVTYSRFARDAVRRDTGLDIPFIPISHDPTIFCPGDKQQARKRLGLPEDRFIVAMVGTNQYRKLWGEFIDAAAELAHEHSDVMVLPFTTWDIQIAGGFDIADLIYRRDVQSQVINPGNMVGQLSAAGMAELYRAVDVLVLTTVGEGAGLPPLRARACGTPALVSDNTSNTEFAGHPYELVKSTITHLDNGSNIARYGTDVQALARKLKRLYRDRPFREEIAAAGIEAMKQYEADRVNPTWDALLEDL
jgi:glycosyltransferase involved in cell wall biosynthesis